MSSIAELMQLCRLCLVKDQVDVPIFEDSGDLHERCLKIAACLPVKVKKDDKLPKKICSGCSYKLDLLYQFYNTSASADKQLKTWLSQLEGGKTIEGEVSSKESLTKSEPSESGDAHSLSADAESYIMQQQKLPYQNVAFPFQEDAFVEPQPSSSGLAEETETRTPSKRKRKTIQTLPVPDSDEEDDPHSKIAKLENDSDSDNDNDNDNFIPDDTSDSEQPGPSGLGKVSGDTPSSRRSSRKRNFPMKTEIKDEPIDWNYSDDSTSKLKVKQENNKSPKAKKSSTKSPPVRSCTKCKMTFSTLKDLNAHKRDVHVVPKPKRYDGFLETGDKFTCMSCNTNTNSKEEIEEHVKTHKQEFTCEHCEKVFDNPYKFSCHLNSHTNAGYTCPFCDFITPRAGSVLSHINHLHLKKFPYYCAFCGKGFSDCKLHQEHENVHTGGERFVCIVCKKDYPFSMYLYMHQVRHHRVNIEGVILTNQCEICRKVFSKMSTLDRHMQKHLDVLSGKEDKKHLCDNCGKEFSGAYKLKLHYRIHTGYKPYNCSYCGKCFTKRDYLVVHERIHNGEKPFSCEYCGKCFNQSAPLRIHLRGHTGERPYVCKYCDIGFISKGALTIHTKACSRVDYDD